MLTRSLARRLMILLLVLTLTGCTRPGPAPQPPGPTMPATQPQASPFRADATLTALAVQLTAAGLASSQTPSGAVAPAGTPVESPSPVPPPTATPFPDLSRLSRVDRYQEALRLMIYPALEQIYNRQPGAALPYLDAAITAVEDHAYLYYLRANVRYQLGERANTAAQAEEALTRARADINQAIALGPANGDYYFLRASIADRYRLLHGTGEPQSWQAELEQHPVLEDLQAARQQGNLTVDRAEWKAAEIMIHMGYCQQALDVLAGLQTAHPETATDAAYHALAAQALACTGELELALAHNYLSIQNDPTTYAYRYTRALLLTALGRPQEALPIIDHYLAAYPGYRGPRLFLRALIYYDLGEFEKARQDFEAGQTPAWGLDGLGAYVGGLLARRAGQVEAGNRLLNQAANSLPTGEYAPLLHRARSEAGAPEGITPVPASIPAALRHMPTPIPTAAPRTVITSTLPAGLPATVTLGPSATPLATVTPWATPTRAASVTPVATITPAVSVTPIASVTPASTSATITPAAGSLPPGTATGTLGGPTASMPHTPVTPIPTTSAVPTPSPSANPAAVSSSFSPAFFTPSHDLPVPYQGTGPFNLPPNGILELYVMPEPPITFTRVISVSFYLIPDAAGASPNQSSGLLMGLFLRSFYETRAQSTWLEPVRWGENPLRVFAGFVDQSGGMHVILNNKTARPVPVQQLGVRVTVERPDGSQATYGFQP